MKKILVITVVLSALFFIGAYFYESYAKKQRLLDEIKNPYLHLIQSENTITRRPIGKDELELEIVNKSRYTTYKNIELSFDIGNNLDAFKKTYDVELKPYHGTTIKERYNVPKEAEYFYVRVRSATIVSQRE